MACDRVTNTVTSSKENTIGSWVLECRVRSSNCNNRGGLSPSAIRAAMTDSATKPSISATSCHAPYTRVSARETTTTGPNSPTCASGEHETPKSGIKMTRIAQDGQERSHRGCGQHQGDHHGGVNVRQAVKNNGSRKRDGKR